LAWHGKGDIRCEEVPDPKIEHPRDAIIKITACAICGSDLHIYGGIIPEMKSGDVIGHENMSPIGHRHQTAGRQSRLGRTPARSRNLPEYDQLRSCPL
jgi:hypothetical protein